PSPRRVSNGRPSGITCAVTAWVSGATAHVSSPDTRSTIPSPPRYPMSFAGSSISRVRALCLLALCAVAPLSAQQARPIRALYITGGGFHDFKAQEKIVPPGVAARTNIVWTIDNTADTSTTTLIARHRTTAWADSFDVVVYNMSFSYVVDTAWIARIAHAHRDKGVAAVILHGATHSYRRGATDAWRELMAAASMRPEKPRE